MTATLTGWAHGGLLARTNGIRCPTLAARRGARRRRVSSAAARPAPCWARESPVRAAARVRVPSSLALAVLAGCGSRPPGDRPDRGRRARHRPPRTRTRTTSCERHRQPVPAAGAGLGVDVRPQPAGRGRDHRRHRDRPRPGSSTASPPRSSTTSPRTSPARSSRTPTTGSPRTPPATSGTSARTAPRTTGSGRARRASWEAGVDGARPSWSDAGRAAGSATATRQEHAPDRRGPQQILAVDATATIGYGASRIVVRTDGPTAASPTVEQKYYGPASAS